MDQSLAGRRRSLRGRLLVAFLALGLVGLGGALYLGRRDLQLSWVRSLAFRTRVERRMDGTADVGQAFYGSGACAIFELGKVRFARPGPLFLWKSGGNFELPHGGSGEKMSGASVGVVYELKREQDGDFTGKVFSIPVRLMGTKLLVEGKELDPVNGPPALIWMDNGGVKIFECGPR